jgi:RNA polymerase sigma factor (sigma-70 family)
MLYRDNNRAVTSFILRNNGTPEDADDLLQEAVVILWEKVHGGMFEQTAKLSTFVFAVVKNLWFRRLARRKKEIPQDMEADIPAIDVPSPLEDLIESEEAETVKKTLDRLGNPCKQLLLLYYWEELSMEAIAQQMGFAGADTVKSKKYQCKKALERLLCKNI